MASPEAIKQPDETHEQTSSQPEAENHESATVQTIEDAQRAQQDKEQAEAMQELVQEDAGQHETKSATSALNKQEEAERERPDEGASVDTEALDEQGRAMKHFIEERIEEEGSTESAKERLARKTSGENVLNAQEDTAERDAEQQQERREARPLQERFRELENAKKERQQRIEELEHKESLSEGEQAELEKARTEQQRAQQYEEHLRQTKAGAEAMDAANTERTSDAEEAAGTAAQEQHSSRSAEEQATEADASSAAEQSNSDTSTEQQAKQEQEALEQRRAEAQKTIDKINPRIKELAKKGNRTSDEEQELEQLKALREKKGEEVTKAQRDSSPEAQQSDEQRQERTRHKKRAMFAREEERTEAEKSPELKALEDKRAKYLQRYQEALKSRSKWEKFKSGLKGLFGKSSDVTVTEGLEGAKSEYEQARTEYAQQLFDKARERIEQKDMPEEKKEQMLQRYKGLVFNEYVAKEYERFQNAKAESYPPREQGLLRRGMQRFSNMHWSKRAGISATLATGASVATGGVATAAGAAGVFAMKGARHGAAALLGPAASESVGWLYEKARAGKVREESKQEQRSAKEQLSRQESASVLNTVEQQYLSAQHRTEREDRRKSALKLATGVATGVGTSFAIMDQASAASSIESGRDSGESAASIADREHLMTEASERASESERGGFFATDEKGSAASGARAEAGSGGWESVSGEEASEREVAADREHLMTEASEPEKGREHLMTEGSEPHEGVAETPAERADREHLMTEASEPEKGREHLMTEGSEPHEGVAESVELPDAYEVQQGDTLQEILNEKYNIRDEDVYAVTDALRQMEESNPEQLKELGLTSGRVDEIYTGDTLNLQGLVEASGEQVETYTDSAASGTEETTSYQGAREAAAAHEAGSEGVAAEASEHAGEEAGTRSIEYIELPDSYEVQPGDTLSEILHEKYHLNEQQTQEIIENLKEIQDENEEQLTTFGISEKDVNDIRPGDLLNLDQMGELIEQEGSEAPTPQEKPSAEILHDGLESREDSTPWLHEEEPAAAEEAPENSSAFEQLSPEQQERVESMLNDRLDELYGTEGIFGFGASPGAESSAWTHLHERDAQEVLRVQASAEEAHEMQVSQLDLAKTQDFLDRARQFAEPRQGESVEDFVKRAYATYVQTHSNT